MILDSLKNSSLYAGLNPRLEKAFELIAQTDWMTVEPGIHELDGKDIYVNVMERELKEKKDAKLEVHDEYIDIQVLVSGTCESFGWSERRDLRMPQSEFNCREGHPALRRRTPDLLHAPSGPVHDPLPGGRTRSDGRPGYGA